MEPLAVLPEGDALFNEEITKDLFAYPTISEVRHKLNGMLAGRPAESPPTTQEQTDVIDGCDAEIALWVQEALEQAADMAADDLVGDRLSERQAALNPPELFDESDEETERSTTSGRRTRRKPWQTELMIQLMMNGTPSSSPK